MPVTPLLLALLVSVGDRTAASPLAGCNALPMSERGWSYACKDATAQRLDGAAYAESSASGIQAGFAALLGEGAEKDRTVVRVGGAEVSALRAWSRTGGTGLVLTLRRPEGTRIVCCLALRGGNACGPILDHLAAEPWRAGVATGAVVQATPPLQFDGRPVSVPKGCEAISLYRASGVRCPSGVQASWVVAADEAEGRRLMEQYARLAETGITFTQKGIVACRLASSDTTCARVLFRVNQGPQIMLWGMARVRDQLLVGFCMGPSGEPLPEPCSLVFALR